MDRPGLGCGAWIEEDGAVLLVLRLRAPERGLWNLPGGKVDLGERTREAVAREVREELGVEITVGDLLCLTEMMEPGHHWVSPVYRAAIVAGRPENREPAKHSEVRWWRVGDLPPRCGLATREAARVLRSR